MPSKEKTVSKVIHVQRAALSDELIVQRVVKGDRELFSEIVSRHQRGIFNFILRMVGQYDLAADLTQEVFMKIFCALDTFNGRHKFSTWIFSIASHFTIDYLRKRKLATFSYEASSDHHREGLKNRIKSKTISPLEQLKNVELRRKILDSIETLEPEYREVILLRHLHGFSYEDISSITDLPIGTVKNRIFRARQILKEQLIPYLIPESV